MDERSEIEEVVRTLAAIEKRGSATVGEREAAEWLEARFATHGCDVVVEEEPAHGTYWWPLGIPMAASALAGAAALAGLRRVAAATSAAAAASIVDDVTSGPRWLRRALLPERRCWNVVATTGDRAARRTVIVMAHHDAPRTGRVFDQRPQRWLMRRFPRLREHMGMAPPVYWALLSGPGLVAAGSLLRQRKMVEAGVAVSAIGTAILADVGRSPVVQGANDNLSGVAGLVFVARALAERPVEGVRVILLSCGAEESFQEGIRGFAARHFADLPPARTWVVNLETVGSPQLVLLEGEGPVRMRDYDSSFKDLVADVAGEAGIRLRRGFRARVTTDSLVTAAAGYPTATLLAIDEFRALSNYHLPSDVPDNLDYATVEDAARLADATVRRIAARP